MATAKCPDRPRRTGHRVAVVGGGMAAARLVQQLAAARMSAEAMGAADGIGVTVIGEESHAAYNRVLLAEVLAGRYVPEVIELPVPAPPPAFAYERLRGVRAIRLDRAARRVQCDDGRSVPYDTLVLATGSNPVLPPLRGLFEPGGRELPYGVHAFRTMADCLALAEAVRPGGRAVVIGGGLLGVSAARALALRGAQTVLAHQGEHLMERQLDAGASRLLRRHVEALGVEVHTECRVRGLLTRRTGTASGTPREAATGSRPGTARHTPYESSRAAEAVELADGFRLDAEIVVLACGVRPRVGLAQAAGLRVARGIVVDDQLRTSDPRVHAIGDCAEHDGVLYGLAGPAQEQADALARILTHDARIPVDDAPTSARAPGSAVPTGPSAQPGRAAPLPRYSGTRALTRLTLATSPITPAAPAASSALTISPFPQLPLDLAAFGDVEPAPGDDVVHLCDATRGAYRKVVVRGNRLVGGILLGDLGGVGALARTWEDDEPLPSAPLLHLLTHDESGGTPHGPLTHHGGS
ncbi:FAD-dependent oxidoreductase [Streptomyces pathocidini]|uniref:NAD(P)/FAD-dependent oxidoreductase n=1 Tax=Streptomyces pathocidini TaxID=1650571 RepID=UPI0033DE3CE7